MIEIRCRNFRGCDSADLTVAPIALLAGLNASGKSSVAQAVGVALVGDAMPADRGSLGALVRVGATEAIVEIEGESGTVSMHWPSGRATSKGEPPMASNHAAGLVSLATMAPRERARALSELLRAEPTREDLALAMHEAGFLPEHIEAVWGWIGTDGWDGAHARRRERGAELKGSWRQVTGANYGSKVAAAYRPDLADLVETDLASAVARLRQEVERAVAAQAVSQAERERLTIEANNIGKYTQAARDADAAVVQCTEELRVAQEARMALPPAEAQQALPCPHCGEAVLIERVNSAEHRLVRYEGGQHVDVKKRRLAIAETEGRIQNITGKLHEARASASAAKLAAQAANDARQKLAQWPQAVETGTDIETARQTLARAERKLEDYRKKTQADDLHERVESNETLLGILAADGLRATKLVEVIGLFNSTLRELCEVAGWRTVIVDPDMGLFFGERPYALLSTSEQYRVRVTLQVALAGRAGDDLVVIDAADVLDAGSRSGLFQLLVQSELPALVCMTASRPEQVPDLHKLGVGASYWLRNGIAEPMSTEAAVAA